MGSATTIPAATVTRREALSRMAIALAVACVGIPLVGPWLARWVAAQERKRLILAQLRHQAQRAIEHSVRKLAEQHYGVVTAIDHQHGTITVAWSGAPLDPMAYAVEPTDSHRYISSLFRVGEPVAIPMPA